MRGDEGVQHVAGLAAARGAGQLVSWAVTHRGSQREARDEKAAEAKKPAKECTLGIAREHIRCSAGDGGGQPGARRQWPPISRSRHGKLTSAFFQDSRLPHASALSVLSIHCFDEETKSHFDYSSIAMEKSFNHVC